MGKEPAVHEKIMSDNTNKNNNKVLCAKSAGKYIIAKCDNVVCEEFQEPDNKNLPKPMMGVGFQELNMYGQGTCGA